MAGLLPALERDRVDRLLLGDGRIAVDVVERVLPVLLLGRRDEEWPEHVGRGAHDLQDGGARGIVARLGGRGRCHALVERRVVVVLLLPGERRHVRVLHRDRVALDEGVEREHLPAGVRPNIERVEVEVLVLERVRELVRDGDAGLDVVEVGTPDDHAFTFGVVETHHRGVVDRVLRGEQVDVAHDEPERPEICREGVGLAAVPGRDLLVRTEGFQELVVGKELHRHRVLEVETTLAFDEARELADPRVPRIGRRGCHGRNGSDRQHDHDGRGGQPYGVGQYWPERRRRTRSAVGGWVLNRFAKLTLRPVNGFTMYAVACAGFTSIGTCLA